MQAKDTRNFFTRWAGRCSAIPRRARLHHMWRWHGKKNAITPIAPLPFPSSSPSFLCWVWWVWNIPWVSWGHLSWLCPLPTSCAPPTYLLVAWVRSRKGLDCVQALLINKENIPELPTHFQAQIQNTTPYKVLWRKWSVSQLKPTQSEKFYLWSKFRLSNPDSDEEFWHISLCTEETWELGGWFCSTQCYPNAT